MRRSDDLWDRYPKPIKSYFNAFIMFMVYAIAFLPVVLIRIAIGADFSGIGEFIIRTLGATVVGILAWNAFRLWRWAKAQTTP